MVSLAEFPWIFAAQLNAMLAQQSATEADRRASMKKRRGRQSVMATETFQVAAKSGSGQQSGPRRRSGRKLLDDDFSEKRADFWP